MKYNIYCKFTGKLLATYTNKETLKTLDTSKCYYVEANEQPKKKEQPSKATDKSVVSAKSTQSSSSSVNNDYMSLLNPSSPMYHSTFSDTSYSSQSSCNSSSSSSYDSSSSSSCDSSSY